MRLPILGRSVGLKKKNLKKKKKQSRIGGLVPPHHSYEARKTTRSKPKNQYGGKVGGYCYKITAGMFCRLKFNYNWKTAGTIK